MLMLSSKYVRIQQLFNSIYRLSFTNCCHHHIKTLNSSFFSNIKREANENDLYQALIIPDILRSKFSEIQIFTLELLCLFKLPSTLTSYYIYIFKALELMFCTHSENPIVLNEEVYHKINEVILKDFRFSDSLKLEFSKFITAYKEKQIPLLNSFDFER